MTKREQFQRLAKEFREGTDGMSSPTQAAKHPAHQQIIDMGPDVVPFILADLRDHGGHWFVALRQLVSDPPKIELTGNYRAVVDTWLDWGQKQGYEL